MFTKAKRPIGLIVTFAVLALATVTAPIALNNPKETKIQTVAAPWTGKTISAHDAQLEERLRQEEAARVQAEQQRLAQEAAAAAAAKAKAERASRAAARPRYAGPITNDIWSALARCESGGRPNAVSRSGKYFGAFQFSLATWRGIGMSGNPIDYPYEVQLDAAKRLQARSGWGQWPTCSRKLGLR